MSGYCQQILSAYSLIQFVATMVIAQDKDDVL